MSFNNWLNGLRLQFSQSGRRRTRTRRLRSTQAAQISGESLEHRLLLTTTYINAGGPALAGDPGFEADDAYENGEGRSIRRRRDVDTSLVDSSLPQSVFQTNLISRRRAGDVQFDVPVTPGSDYQVDLLFSELQARGFRQGARVFDVALEGSVVLDDFDIFSEAGARTAISRSFNVTATDSNLDIDLTAITGSSAIAGIIVTDLSDDPEPPANNPPVISDVPNQVISENGTTGPLDFTTSDPDGDSVSVTATTSNPALLPVSNIVISGTGTDRTVTATPTADNSGTAVVTLTASDGTATVSDTFSVTVNEDDGPVDPPPPTNTGAVYLNAGGPAVGEFENAGAFAGTSRVFAPRRPAGIAGVPSNIPESVFQTSLFTRRRDGDLHFDIPTDVGMEYQVDLLFSEPQKRAGGRRVFDVSIDGQLVLNDFDIFSSAGGRNAAVTERFTIVGDGNLDIDLSRIRSNPLIAGIVVMPLQDGGPTDPGGNQAPQLAAIGNQTVARNSTLQFNVSATDPDGDAITYSVDTAGLPGNPTINPQLGSFSWTPPAAGTFNVTVRASDGSLSDSETFSVTVTDGPGGNQAPVLSPIGDQQATVGNQLTFTASATDPDPGDTVQYFLGPDAPAGAAVNATSGTVTWTPSASQTGATSFTVLASDGLLNASQVVNVTVTDPNSTNNSPSFAPIGNQTVEADQTLTVNASATDPDAGDTLTYSLDTPGLPGTPTVDSQSGQFTWTPPGSAVPGPFQVTLRVTDQGGLSDTVSFSVSVTAPGTPNNVPVLDAIGNQQVAAGSELTFTATAFDADGPNDPLQFFLSADAPAGASINPGTGVFTWTPTPGDAGPHTFSVGVTDNKDTDSETITVTVTAGNSSNTAPMIDPIADQTIQQGDQLQLTVSATDQDAGDTLTYSLLTTGLPGNPQIDPTTGVFTWTPPFADGPGFQVEVGVTDAGGLTDSETFTVAVTQAPDTNSPPVFDPIANQNANVGEQLTFTVSATDSDVPPDTLTFFLDPTAPVGTAINGSTGEFTWTPENEGTFTFPILVGDGTVNVSQNVTIVVGPALQNQAPAFGPIGNQTVEVNRELQFTLPASDADNDTLTFTLVTAGLPGNPQLDSASGVFTWTPTQISPGFNVTVRVEDGRGGSDEATFTVTVNDGSPVGNTPPTVNPIPNQQATVGTQLAFTVGASDPDPGTTLDFFLDPTAPNGAGINSQTGAFTWTPTTGDVGTVTFPIFVSDGTVNVSAQVTVVVSASNGGGGGGPNSAPSFGPQNNRSVAAGSTLNVTITAIDDDPGDVLTYTLVTTGLPGNPMLNSSTGQLTWTPPASAAGQNFQVSIRATDPDGLSDDAIFTVNVLPAGSANQAPVLNDIPNQQATVSQQLSFTAVATDADGDNLTYFLDPTAPFGAGINATTGQFTWTPAASDVGTQTFPIFVSDGTTNVSKQVTVVVSESGGGGGNTSPSLAPIDNQTINEGQELTVTPVVDDPDQGDTLTFELLTTDLPGNAAINVQTGVFTWTPPSDAGPQTYTVNIRVRDAAGATSTGTFNVQVNDTL